MLKENEWYGIEFQKAMTQFLDENLTQKTDKIKL